MTSGVELRVLCDSCLFPFAFELRFTRFVGACLQSMAPSGIACKQAPTFREIRLNVIANGNWVDRGVSGGGMPRTRRLNKGRNSLLVGKFLGAEALRPRRSQSQAEPTKKPKFLNGLASGLGIFFTHPLFHPLLRRWALRDDRRSVRRRG